jgi:hypothetical protein
MAVQPQPPPCVDPPAITCPCCGGVGSHHAQGAQLFPDRRCTTCAGWGVLAGVQVAVWNMFEDLVAAYQRGRM